MDNGASGKRIDTHTEVDLAGFEPVHVDAIHCWVKSRGQDVDVLVVTFGGCWADASPLGRVYALVDVDQDTDQTTLSNVHAMASRQLGTLYRELLRAFDARPTDLKKCGALLAQLKVSCRSIVIPGDIVLNDPKIGLIQTGLLIPTAESNLQDLVVSRRCPRLSTSPMSSHLDTGDILEIGAFCSIRAKDVPSFDRYFSQLQTFYTDFRSGPSRQLPKVYPSLIASTDPFSPLLNANSPFAG